MTPQDVIVHMNKLNIEYERKFNERTFILNNKNYDDDNLIVLFITQDGFKIILYNDNTLLKEENFKLIENLYGKYNYFKKVSKYYKK